MLAISRKKFRGDFVVPESVKDLYSSDMIIPCVSELCWRLGIHRNGQICCWNGILLTVLETVFLVG